MAIQDVIQNLLQDKKKLVIFGGGVLLIVVIIILLFSSGSNPQPVNTGLVSQIVMARGETKDRKPINPTEVFSINDPEIHAIVSLSSLPINTTILFQWYDLKGKKSIKDDSRGTGETTFSGLSSSSIVRATEGENKLDWGLGSYEFRVLINGKLAGSKQFVVQTDKEIEKNQVLTSIGDIQLTTAVDLQGNPTRSISNLFSTDDEDIFASIAYNNLPKKITLEGRWVFLNDGRLVDKYQKTIIGTGIFAFGINANTHSWIPTKKWPIGKYRLEMYLDNELLDKIDFEVE